jgi:hypothetical protein
MAEDFRPIGPKYHRAFDDAIAAYRKWAPNAPEPTVSLDHQEITMTFCAISSGTMANQCRPD